MIPYEFVPVDRSFLKFLYNGNFSKNETLVLIVIAEDIFSWPEKLACASSSKMSRGAGLPSFKFSARCASLYWQNWAGASKRLKSAGIPELFLEKKSGEF